MEKVNFKKSLQQTSRFVSLVCLFWIVGVSNSIAQSLVSADEATQKLALECKTLEKQLQSNSNSTISAAYIADKMKLQYYFRVYEVIAFDNLSVDAAIKVAMRDMKKKPLSYYEVGVEHVKEFPIDPNLEAQITLFLSN